MRRLAATALLAALTVLGAPADAQSTAAPVLAFEPIGAPVGREITARASGLPAAITVSLLWHTGRGTWRVEDGKFFGITAPDEARAIATGTTDAGGRLSLRFRVPEDYGFIHDVEVVSSDGRPLATQGFTVVPQLEITPRAGPPGTPIQIRMTGLGYRFYESIWHLLYDGTRTGWLSAITTHGTARATIPASGELGVHTLQVIEGPTAPYLNGEQSPVFQSLIPQDFAQTFRVVAGAVVRPPQPAAQAATRRPAAPAPASEAALETDYASGTVGSALVVRGRGFAPNAPVALQWETVVGNRLSASGWAPQLRPLAHITADAGGRFTTRVATPDDLGGNHRILVAGATAQIATTYTIVPSALPIAPARVRPGGEITIRMKGIGYTETGNTYTMVVDNGYFGYGCGFNSQGDVTIHIHAPGRVGTHFVDLYPTIYRGQVFGPGAPPAGASVNGSYFLLPMLNAADHPGEPYPAFRLSFDVV